MNLDNLPDQDIFAMDNMFGALNDVESVVSRVIGAALMCFDNPEQVGNLNVDKRNQVVEHAVRRIAELQAQPADTTPPPA